MVNIMICGYSVSPRPALSGGLARRAPAPLYRERGRTGAVLAAHHGRIRGAIIEGEIAMTDANAATSSGGDTGGERWLLALLVVILLAGLPIAVWLDLRNLSEDLLRRQASDMNSLITSVRGFYSKNVVGRILAAHGTPTQVVHNYEDIPGAIPIPATLSLELGKVINEQQANINYRFVSDFPFKGRAPHP